MLTIERLREVLAYDPSTGVFTWRHDKRGGVKAGDEAGCVNKRGYRLIRIDGRLYRANRLALLHVNGTWPVGDADHVNLNKSDNRGGNLRDALDGVNQQNVADLPRKNNKGGVLGVSLSTRRPRAQITVDGKTKHLGYFDTADEAKAAYVAAKREFHPGNTL